MAMKESRFDKLYEKIILESRTSGIVEEKIDLGEAWRKTKAMLGSLRTSLKEKAKALLNTPLVKKAIEKYGLKKRADWLFDMIFRTKIDGDTLTVDLASKEEAIEKIKEAFPKKEELAEESITDKAVGAYIGTMFTGFSGLNMIWPWLWVIALMMLVAPVLAYKVIEWRRAKVVHYKIMRDGKTIYESTDFDDFEKILEKEVETNCEIVAKSYRMTDMSETTIHAELLNPKHSFVDHSFSDKPEKDK